MSWTCPHQIKDHFCGRRNKKCEPGAKGCVVEKKFKFVGDNSTDSDRAIKKRRRKG